MTDQQKPERGRFVADGEKVILLHEDGRIEGVDRRPKPSDGGDFVYRKPETTYGTEVPGNPSDDPGFDDLVRRRIDRALSERADFDRPVNQLHRREMVTHVQAVPEIIALLGKPLREERGFLDIQVRLTWMWTLEQYEERKPIIDKLMPYRRDDSNDD